MQFRQVFVVRPPENMFNLGQNSFLHDGISHSRFSSADHFGANDNSSVLICNYHLSGYNSPVKLPMDYYHHRDELWTRCSPNSVPSVRASRVDGTHNGLMQFLLKLFFPYSNQTFSNLQVHDEIIPYVHNYSIDRFYPPVLYGFIKITFM